MPMSATNAPPAAPSAPSAPDSGTEAVPFRQFLLKVHSRCNLACTYCYMYEAADQSWRQRPRSMAPATVRRASRLMAEHATEHALSEVHVVLHGGEPLLVGAEYLEDLLGTVTDALAGIATPRFSLQTNGIRLAEDPRLLPVLGRHGVRIGVSLDGTPAAHDRHRRRADGKGSYAATARALELLTEPAHRHLFAGLLCVIDPTTKPLETYEALLRFAPPRLDLLLPHGTWQAPPPGLDARISPPSAAPAPGAAACATPYADWLCAVFDRWYGAPRRETGIRLFEEIMVLLLGGTARSEVVGLTPVDLVVVETDGSIEQADSLKVSYPGAPETGLHVLRDTFAVAAAHPAFRARQRGLGGLGPVCRSCTRSRVCGGGLYAHRYAPGATPVFSAPSVYCDDLAVLVDHIGARLRQDVAALAVPRRKASR
ncbi:FxsB family radical SAM/SPASM domain protein [Streptomyces sp. MNU76]|uniref:FxsB family cyclophane-forming radical SAM/SPASM peptide maturase n=1 Tax=Streptomyces sp. MNU76 TaxID=2560026 RepID=UPI001E541993|nr:FxsB family cyclophane-forming radical SAM/SPASM peptide maturase [Streptomyces sp. MNU76]MCC9709431.1 FxsB family radical SAM/SPASM domain protein [Streptomyces sp. MNU76]